MKTISFFTLFILLLMSCNDDQKSNQLLEENTTDAKVKAAPIVAVANNDPVVDCDEFLSPFELIELWEMMKADNYHDRSICFGGYIVSKNVDDNTSKGMISFRSFKGETIIPMVECEFSGKYKADFQNYNVGDKVRIVGKLMTVDDHDNHNFIFTNCSIKQ